MFQIHGAVLFHVQQVDLVSLLLQSGQAAADGRVLQRGRDDVLAVVAFQPGKALDGEVVGLAGTGCINDLGGLHLQAAGNALGGFIDDRFGGGTGLMMGICVAGAAALDVTEALQDLLVRRGIGRIVQINHESS